MSKSNFHHTARDIHGTFTRHLRDIYETFIGFKYTYDGITIAKKLYSHNNPLENSIRPGADGRKNYLFAGNHEATTALDLSFRA